MADNPGVIDARFIPLGFISEDVHGQIKNARAILTEIERLRDVADTLEDANAKAAVNQSLQRLIAVANNMSVNALSTTTGASVSVSGVTFPSVYHKK
jgi:hypothetical protein